MNKRPLPDMFLENMKNLFDEFHRNDEYDALIQSLSQEPKRGIRMNMQKLGDIDEAENILRQMNIESEPYNEPDENKNENLSFLNRIPWSDDGYYISNDFFPGRHFFYLAGLFYIQEPSAMLPANVLVAKPGEHILDLCAAPGGKTAKIVADMKGEGILFSNDINETRVKALVRNVELMGSTNCVVLNETPEKIARYLPGYFDKILLDAPCSGEGMFRRDPEAIDSWGKFGNLACVKMQKEILTHVDCLLKPGGIIVYSTCTFSTKENEEMIQWFITEFPWYDVLPINKSDGIDSGMSHNKNIENTARIFPHHAQGEGHFCAKIQKRTVIENIDNIDNIDNIYYIENIENQKDSNSNLSLKQPANMAKTQSNKRRNKYQEEIKSELYEFTTNDFIESFKVFSKYVLTTQCVYNVLKSCSIHLQIVKGHVYSLPEAIPSLDGLKISKKGLYLGELKKAKGKIIFEPSHSFLLSRNQSDLSNPISFSTNDPLLLKYYKGETIIYPQMNYIEANDVEANDVEVKDVEAKDIGANDVEANDVDLDESKIQSAKECARSIRERKNYEVGRFIPICVQGYPIGWGKGMQGDIIKNLYPQGWRKN